MKKKIIILLFVLLCLYFLNALLISPWRSYNEYLSYKQIFDKRDFVDKLDDESKKNLFSLPAENVQRIRKAIKDASGIKEAKKLIEGIKDLKVTVNIDDGELKFSKAEEFAINADRFTTDRKVFGKKKSAPKIQADIPDSKIIDPNSAKGAIVAVTEEKQKAAMEVFSLADAQKAKIAEIGNDTKLSETQKKEFITEINNLDPALILNKAQFQKAVEIAEQ